MSRIGKLPVPVPANVKVAVAESTVLVEGPKGKLSFGFQPTIKVDVQEGGREVVVARSSEEGQIKALHGLTRALIANMVKGVTEGYVKKLEIQGVGYQAQVKGANEIELQVGFANKVRLKAPAGVEVKATDPTHIVVSGIDKQAVGQFAAEIRRVRPPEPYKGKGIRYEGEAVRRKAGKTTGGK